MKIKTLCIINVGDIYGITDQRAVCGNIGVILIALLVL